jgi:signal peptidase I
VRATEPTQRMQVTVRPPSSGDGADGFIAFLKDNFEAIAVAVVMALVIKHFCVEAFKIPTSSMYPTLRGESDNVGGDGDRILVDKWSYLFGAPERWDVIVFRYPLNPARNFIKRIVGLPGERMRISSQGDIWVRDLATTEGPDDLRIAQRPALVREQFYRPVYPPDASTDTEEESEMLRRIWHSQGEAANGWRTESARSFAYAGTGVAELYTARRINEMTTPDSWAHGSGSGELARDLRVRASVRFEAPVADPAGAPATTAPAPGDTTPTTFALSWRPGDELLAVLRLGTEPGSSEAFIRRNTEIVASKTLDVVLDRSGTTQCQLEYVDGHLHAYVNGEQLAVLSDGRHWDDTRSGLDEQRLTLKAEGAAFFVEDLRIDREEGYENRWDNAEAQREGVDVPAESYFMLGDNTSNSSDSRRWRLQTVHLVGGRTIVHEKGEARYLDRGEAPDEGSWKRVVDSDGITRTWREEDEDGELGSPAYPAPFVHRDLIVGRAFLVFWPCWPDFPGRLGFIH